MIQTFEVQVELVSGVTVYMILAEVDADSAKRVALRNIEDIRKAGYYADEISAQAIRPLRRLVEDEE